MRIQHVHPSEFISLTTHSSVPASLPMFAPGVDVSYAFHDAGDLETFYSSCYGDYSTCSSGDGKS